MQIKGHEIPIRKALVVSARATLLIVSICAVGRPVALGQARSDQIAQTGPIIVAQDNNVIITQGQMHAPNIIASKLPPRVIDDHFRDLVRTNLTDKSVPIVTMVLIGEDQDERTDLADKIENFLRSERYIVRPRAYFLAAGGSVPKGIVIDNKSNPATIKIGANVGNAQ